MIQWTGVYYSQGTLLVISGWYEKKLNDQFQKVTVQESYPLVNKGLH